jgi:hypothetical protein
MDEEAGFSLSSMIFAGDSAEPSAAKMHCDRKMIILVKFIGI